MGKQLIKSLFILSLFTAFITNVHANYTAKDNGSIKGKIVSDDGTPVENASVRLKETSKHTLSNANGFFELNNVPSGTYKLTVSSVGYKAYQQSISVGASDDTLIITLKASAGELSDVSILSGINKFNKKETDDVARLPLKNIENPQVYSVIPKEIISEQMVTDYNSVFKNVPGAGVPVVYNQGRSTLLSRGFVTANYIRNSISGFVFTSVDPANLEVLEAIKGPSGTLFNSSQTSFGGLFNRVTKKPFDGDRTELSYTGGGNSLNRITFDINHPLDSNKTVLMRINGALHTEQSFQDFGFTKSMMIAPSFVYKVNDRLNFLFDIEASTFNATSPIRFAPYTKGSIHNIKDLGMDYKKSFTNNSLDYTTQQLNIYGQINYKISDKWKLQTNLTRTYSTTKGFVTMLTAKSDNTLQQSIQNENYPYNGVEVQQNIIGDFKIGSLRNRIVAGIDYYNQRSDRSTPTDTMPVINFRNPGAAYYNFNATVVDALTPTKYDIYRTNQFTYSAYVSDVLNITDRLNVMLSLRGDHLVDKGTFYPANDSISGAYHQNALSPKLGIVYELIKDQLSFFGNYMNGFSNTQGTDYNGNTFKPEQANQWEIGLKADALNHRLSSTVSYYHISVSNMTRQDLEHSNYEIQDGTQLSRGVEAEVIANPLDGLNIVAGYTYNNSKFTKSDSSVLGLRPATAGPSKLANLWLSYRFLRGSVRGLGVGVGGNYGNSSFQTNTKAFVFTIPSYTTLDATVFYDATKWRIGLKVDNLTNEHYWSIRLAPQMLRRLSANFTFRF